MPLNFVILSEVLKDLSSWAKRPAGSRSRRTS